MSYRYISYSRIKYKSLQVYNKPAIFNYFYFPWYTCTIIIEYSKVIYIYIRNSLQKMPTSQLIKNDYNSNKKKYRRLQYFSK